ncbi:MAG: DUF58 domain-containing protein [Candidatus Nanohaloarchaea archaeon]
MKKVLGSDQIADEIDVEVKRVSELFRLILKYKEQFQASGIEFSDLREYVSSDDASRIDWKNSAKTQDLYVKEYEEEKDMDTFILLDVSDTMMFGTAEKLKSEYASVMAAALAYGSVDAGINVGIGMFGDDQRIITPGGGQEQYQKILHELTDPENYGGKLNLEDALSDTIGQIKEDTAVFIISDFLEIEGDWKANMKLGNIKFRHMLSIITRDLRDYRIPEVGNMRFESPDGKNQSLVNTAQQAEKFNRKAEKEEEELKDKLRSSGSASIKVDTRDNFAAKFAKFFDQNREGW